MSLDYKVKKSKWWDWTIFMPRTISNGIWPFGIFLAEDAEKWSKRTKWRVLRHEETHLMQQYQWYSTAWVFGLLAWYVCYVFLLPFWFNPFRWKWEMEAYMRGQEYGKVIISRHYLSEKTYGWLKPSWHGWVEARSPLDFE